MSSLIEGTLACVPKCLADLFRVRVPFLQTENTTQKRHNFAKFDQEVHRCPVDDAGCLTLSLQPRSWVEDLMGNGTLWFLKLVTGRNIVHSKAFQNPFPVTPRPGFALHQPFPEST